MELKESHGKGTQNSERKNTKKKNLAKGTTEQVQPTTAQDIIIIIIII